MKLIFTSDIHHKKYIIDYILENYNVDGYYDCGDSELLPNELQNFLTVKGNCDFRNYPIYRIINVDENVKIFITHGHLLESKKIIEAIKNNNCNIIISGHTHIKRFEIDKGVYYLNPGSISRPRDKDSNTFLLFDYNEVSKNINIEFIKLSL